MIYNWFSFIWKDAVYSLNVGLKGTVAKNTGALYLILFANYLLPLLMIPYLVRVLGPSGFGLVAFGQGLIAYFTIFTDYGFALSATRKISLQRDDVLAISRTAFNVWATKALLGIGSFLILLTAIALIPKLQESSALFLILYGIVLGNMLFPTWLFQGMEKMVALSIINLLMQSLMLVGVFIFIHKPDDYIIYAGILSIISILTGLFGACISVSMFKLHFVLPTLKGVLETLREGRVIFLSMASVSLYTTGNAFILGLLTNTTAVGYYSAAEKIVTAVSGLLGPITQSVYPKFSRLAFESKDLALQWGRRILVVVGIIGLFLSIILFLFAPFIVRIILGSDYGPSILVLQILSILPFLVGISNIFGIQIMIPFGREKSVTIILVFAGLINIILALILAPILYEPGMGIAVVLSETFVAISMFIYLWKNQINPLQRKEILS